MPFPKALDNPKVTLEWDYPAPLPAVVSDTGELKIILQNLINNAWCRRGKEQITFLFIVWTF